MTNEKPKVSKCGRYPIGKAAALLQVNRHTLRRWINAGAVTPRYNQAQRAILTGEQIIELWYNF